MYRRRRIKREIAFSFDSFLDLVANVCGILIRLILVAWVGARSYHAVAANQYGDAEPTVTWNGESELASLRESFDASLRTEREELSLLETRLLDQLRSYQELQATNSETARKLAALASAQAATDNKRAALEREALQAGGYVASAAPSLAEMKGRIERLKAELRELEKSTPATKSLLYRTPVSRPVHTEELHFECRGGKITFIDVQAFLIDIRREMQVKSELLKTRWEVESATSPVGAFRLRYVVERERGLLDAAGMPNPDANFRYGLSAWTVEPINPARGETTAVSLNAGSDFRRLVDALDPEQSAVTLWVYPDSFEIYRQVRDFLYERGVEVAGRPLPNGVAIASSRNGTASRAQ